MPTSVGMTGQIQLFFVETKFEIAHMILVPPLNHNPLRNDIGQVILLQKTA